MITEIVVATRNMKKLEEVKYMLKDLDLKIKSLADYKNLPKIIEDGSTFKDNAIKKAMIIAKYLNKPTLGEDSGLEVEVLGGRPGVYSSRYSGKGATDNKNNKKLLRELKNIPLLKRKARYVCAIALADGDGLVGVVQGDCRGLIAIKERGGAGFGYDPLFLIPKFKKTFGELGEEIKHKMSHRFKAFQKAHKLILSF